MTGFGRQMIEETKEYVEANYNVAKGYEHDAVVIFGGTPPRRWLFFFYARPDWSLHRSSSTETPTR